MRAALRIAALAGWLMLCLPCHLIASLAGRSRWPTRFLFGVARICGAKVRTHGRLSTRHALLVANHRSWLDIPVLAGATGCAFISKVEMGSHPVLKWLVDMNRTVYVDRSDSRSLPGQVERVRSALSGDQPLALFPEATVASGPNLLPFRPSLFTAVVPPPPGCAVHPVAIAYGPDSPDLGWADGETGIGNALRILGHKGSFAVNVTILPPLDPTLDRKAMARSAHDAIANSLAPSGIGPAPLYAVGR